MQNGVVNKELGMEIFTFEFCPCKYESAFETVSLHFNKIDAYKTMRHWKKKELDEWNEARQTFGKKGYRGEKPCDDMLFRVVKRTVR